MDLTHTDELRVRVKRHKEGGASGASDLGTGPVVTVDAQTRRARQSVRVTLQ